MKAQLHRTEDSLTYIIGAGMFLRERTATNHIPGGHEVKDYYVTFPFTNHENHFTEEQWKALVKFIKENYE